MVKPPVVLLVRNAYHFDFGGGERYPVYLARELAATSIHPIVASKHPSIKNLAGQNNIDFIKMPWLNSQNFSGTRLALIPLYALWQLRLIYWYVRAIKKYKPVALHLQSRDDFIAGTIAGRICSIKVIWTDHADLKYIYMNTGKFLRNPIGKMVKLCAKLATTIIIVSKNEQKLISGSLGENLGENYRVIYNGITDTPVVERRTEKSSTTMFVATSRLVTAKGIGELIDATNKLSDEGFDIKTVLLGDGPDAGELKKRAGKDIVFLGFPDDYLSVVKGSDIFVHPSYNEGFSLSLVEAAMLSMPVIATNVGGNPEIIRDQETGILVQPMDVQALYEAMLFAIKNKKDVQLYGKELRKLYLERFQFDRIVREQLIPLYNSK